MKITLQRWLVVSEVKSKADLVPDGLLLDRRSKAAFQRRFGRKKHSRIHSSAHTARKKVLWKIHIPYSLTHKNTKTKMDVVMEDFGDTLPTSSIFFLFSGVWAW